MAGLITRERHRRGPLAHQHRRRRRRLRHAEGRGRRLDEGPLPLPRRAQPEFHVRPQVGRYHCFGCGEDGDVFSFVHEAWTTRPSRRPSSGWPRGSASPCTTKTAAGRAPTTATARGSSPRTRPRASSSREQLTTAAAEPAPPVPRRARVRPGGRRSASASASPRSRSTRSRTHLKGRGFTDEELVTAGLVSQGDRSPYDRFRGRLVWPIRDVTGRDHRLRRPPPPRRRQGPEVPEHPRDPDLPQVAGALRARPRPPRHLASASRSSSSRATPTSWPATSRASRPPSPPAARRSASTTSRCCARCSATSAGRPERHGEVVFTFDPDEAGQQAASRAFAEEQRFAAQTYVAVAPDGLDPCDLRLARGDDAVRRLVDEQASDVRVHDPPHARRPRPRDGRGPRRAPCARRARARRHPRPLARPRATCASSPAGSAWRSPRSVERSRPPASCGAAAAAGRPVRRGSGATAGPVRHEPAAPPEEPVAGIRSLPNDPITPHRARRRDGDGAAAHVRRGSDCSGSPRRPRSRRRCSPSCATPSSPASTSLGAADWLDGCSPTSGAVPRPGAGARRSRRSPRATREDLATYCRGIVVALVERDLLARKASLLGQLQRADPHEQAERRARDPAAARRPRRAADAVARRRRGVLGLVGLLVCAGSHGAPRASRRGGTNRRKVRLRAAVRATSATA